MTNKKREKGNVLEEILNINKLLNAFNEMLIFKMVQFRLLLYFKNKFKLVKKISYVRG